MSSHKAQDETELKQSSRLYCTSEVDIFKNLILRGNAKPTVGIEITVQNKTDKPARIAVVKDRSDGGFTTVAPGKSTSFDVLETTEWVYVSAFIDPSGENKKVVHEHKLHLWGNGHPHTQSEIPVRNKSNKVAKVTVCEDRSCEDNSSNVGPNETHPFLVDATTKLAYVTVVLDPNGEKREMCRYHQCWIGRTVTITEDGISSQL